MPQYQVLQIFELPNRKIRCQTRLHPLLPLNPQPHIRLLYHRHIISPVPHTRYPLPSSFFQAVCDYRFLSWAAAADTDGFCERGDFEEVGVEVFVVGDDGEGVTVDHEHLGAVAFLVFGDVGLDAFLCSQTDHFKNSLLLCLQPCRNSDALRCFYFIAGQHPYLDVGLADFLDSQSDVFLE